MMKKIQPDDSNKDKFVKFLKGNRAFSKFERNRIKSNRWFNLRESLKEHIETCDRQSAVYIDSAFPSGITPEGKTYWININKIWIKENKLIVSLFM